MFALKIVTTTFIALFMAAIGWFMTSLTRADKASFVCFTAMEVTFIMAIACMWG